MFLKIDFDWIRQIVIFDDDKNENFAKNSIVGSKKNQIEEYAKIVKNFQEPKA